jgi:hypothetical protein
MAHMVMVMAINCDQVLKFGKEEREKQNPMGSRQRYKIGYVFCRSRHNRVRDRI